jgi:hypothetical protein
LTTLNACDESGREQTIAYIREPTAQEYGTLDTYSISSCDSRHKAKDYLKYVVNGMLSNFALYILNS